MDTVIVALEQVYRIYNGERIVAPRDVAMHVMHDDWSTVADPGGSERYIPGRVSIPLTRAQYKMKK